MLEPIDCHPFVEAELLAFHTDPNLAEGRHSHCWRVRIYYAAKPFRDGRVMQVALERMLESWQGRDLPAALWATEDMAPAILRMVATLGTGDPQGVEVWRADGPGAVARWRRDA